MTPDSLYEPDIRIEQHDRSAIITTRNRTLSMRLLDSSDDIRRHLVSFTENIETKRPRGLPVEPADAATFICTARRAAYNCLVDCTIDSLKSVNDAVDELLKQIGNALARKAPLSVEIVSNTTDYLPWEWLGGRDDEHDYLAAARSTLGYAAVAYRIAGRGESPAASAFLEAEPLPEPELQLRFLRNPQLHGTAAEEAWFDVNDDLRLVGPLPKLPSKAGFALAEQLANPFLPMPGEAPLKYPDRIVHISCHHRATEDPRTASAYSLARLEGVLAFDDDPKHAIVVTQLQHDLAALQSKLTAAGGPLSRHIDMPLVFFSACSGDFLPFTVESIARVLLRNGNRAVISTSMQVPDNVAAKLAEFFYRRLLQGETSAEALFSAKWELLNNQASPLGLLYNYHGYPNLRIAPLRNACVQRPIL